MSDLLLEIRDCHKSFGPVNALQGVNLSIGKGEIHALIGENGAGKSTLMKVHSGAHTPDRGTILWQGKPYHPQGPSDARDAGIAMIYQELNLAPHLTIEENIYLGMEQHRWGWVRPRVDKVGEALNWLGQQDLSPQTRVGSLPLGRRQMVEIARALVTDARLIIMDEPTSSLSAKDAQALFEAIRKLKDRGISVIYISHFLEEAQELCDRYTVLRDGQTVAQGDWSNTGLSDIVRHMVGRSVEELYPHLPHEQGEVLLTVDHLAGVDLPENVSFQVRKGEILGIAGIVGAGRSESIRCLFGLDKAEKGTLQFRRNKHLEAANMNPANALLHGLDLLSENRKEEGLAVNLSILTNMTLSRLGAYRTPIGWLQLGREEQTVNKWIERLQIKCSGPHAPASSLSGGNQQKICIGRLLHHNSDILLLDEPTRGIDVGSKAEIYRLIQELAVQGKAIVVISSYLPELLGICDSLAVMHRGQLSPVRPIKNWNEHAIMTFATSGQLLQA